MGFDITLPLALLCKRLMGKAIEFAFTEYEVQNNVIHSEQCKSE